MGFSADVTRQSYNESNGGVSGTYGDATLSASYELDLWGGRHAALAAARASLAASRFDREAMALTVTAQVADSYFQILAARERLRIARDNLTNARAVLDQVEAHTRAGKGLARDVAEQRALVATQEAAIPALQQNETEVLVALALLLDQPVQSFTVAGSDLAAIQTPQLRPGLPSDLLARRPDIASAEAQLEAANANVAVARAALLPQIDLTASGGTQTLLAGTGAGTARLYTLAAGLTQPLFDHGALAGQRDYTLAQREELVARYRIAVVAAFGDVEKALQGIDHSSRQELAQEQVVNESQQAFELDTLQYRAGAEDLLNVLSTQRTLYAAHDQRVQVRLAHLQALVGLYRALGGGWQAPQ